MANQHSSNFRDPMIRDAMTLQEALFAKIRLSSSDPNMVDRALGLLNVMAMCWDDSKSKNKDMAYALESLKKHIMKGQIDSIDPNSIKV